MKNIGIAVRADSVEILIEVLRMSKPPTQATIPPKNTLRAYLHLVSGGEAGKEKDKNREKEKVVFEVEGQRYGLWVVGCVALRLVG